jgi:FkbM family methyltransferase
MIDLTNFDWGPTSDWFKTESTKEIFERGDYEKVFEVEEGDIVVDIGASVGEFTYSILKKNPKHCYVVEPLPVFFDTLKKNLEGNQVSFTNAAITSDKYCNITWDGYTQETNTLTFSDFIKINRLHKIDFLKFDCEGGEYDIFSKENLEFLKKTPKIVCEVHLGNNILKSKFRYFRDNILPHFANYHVYSVDGHGIKWDLQNEHFIEYYSEVYFYIDNR